MDLIEVRLEAPVYFDSESGYWTGQPNIALLDEALNGAALPPDVQAVRNGSGVLLRGRRSAVDRAAELLEARGLEKREP